MKVLFISSGVTPADIAPFIKSQGESLKEKGIQVDYFVTGEKGMKGYLNAARRLRRYLKENHYDLLHAHYAFCGWAAVLARPRIPIIVSYMGCDVYGDVKENGKRTRYFNIFLAKLLQPFVQRIIVKSSNLANYVYTKKKLHTIPNGVNFRQFKPLDKHTCRQRLGLPLGDKLILFLGDGSDPRKNVKLLEEAVTLLKDPQVKLIMPYPIRHHEVVDYLNAADVLALTSYLEGSPNVVKEAMVCNCPIVATGVGDVKEVLKDTEGCYITTFDPQDTARKLEQALAFSKNGNRTTGRQTIAHLDEQVIADKIIKIYGSLL